MSSPRNTTLDILRVIGMVFVMFIHSPFGADNGSSTVPFFLKGFIGCGAVPVFFLLSGYLGARKMESLSVSARSFCREKFWTLVIPFLFWNSLVLALVLCAKYAGLASGLRGNGGYFDVDLSAASMVSALLGIGRSPIVYQFWFLRDLIVVVFAAFFLCRYFRRIPLLPWLLFLVPVPMLSSLAYYLLGQSLNPQLSPEKLPNIRSCASYCVCWVLIGMASLIGKIQVPWPLLQIGSAAFLLMLAVIIGSTPLGSPLARLGTVVFFVYATHEPLQSLLGKLLVCFHVSACGSFACFLLIPAIVFSFCALAYFTLRRIFPRLMALATGGR